MQWEQESWETHQLWQQQWKEWRVRVVPQKMCPTGLQKWLLSGHSALSCLLQLINIHENNSPCLYFNHGIVPKSGLVTLTQKFLNIALCWQEWEAALASLGLQEELKFGDPKPRWGPATIPSPKENPGILKGAVLPVACLRGFQQISWQRKTPFIPCLVPCFQSCWISLRRAESSQTHAESCLGSRSWWLGGCGSCDIWEAAPAGQVWNFIFCLLIDFWFCPPYDSLCCTLQKNVFRALVEIITQRAVLTNLKHMSAV